MYEFPITDRRWELEVQRDTEWALYTIDQSLLLGKFKVWCYQHVLPPKILWPKTLYEVALSRVEQRINVKVNK